MHSPSFAENYRTCQFNSLPLEFKWIYPSVKIFPLCILPPSSQDSGDPSVKCSKKNSSGELSWLVISAVIKNLLIWLKCIKAKQTKIFGVKKPPQVPELVKKNQHSWRLTTSPPRFLGHDFTFYMCFLTIFFKKICQKMHSAAKKNTLIVPIFSQNHQRKLVKPKILKVWPTKMNKLLFFFYSFF